MSLFNGYSVISGTVTLIELFSMDGHCIPACKLVPCYRLESIGISRGGNQTNQRDARMNIAVNQVNHAS